MIVGTAGHIDHGKTTLVKAITGVDCDTLKEEKSRGITLDLGYAYAEAGLLGFVDVPGHERLVRQMLAGATGIDFLLLVVAADDGPMPQTREHLAIAGLLGLTRGAVALTKADAVTPARLAAARAEVGALLAGTPIADAPVFPVASPTGAGVAELRDHLVAAARGFVPRPVAGGFRLAVDRVFSLPGAGLVVTGTAHAGSIAGGDAVTVTPPGLAARVRGLHVQNLPAPSGAAGQRIAINLAGGIAKDDLTRGMWVVAPHLHLPVLRFHGELTALEPVRHWQPVHVHLGAADVGGRLALLEGQTLVPGTSMLAEIVLDRPCAALAGDRFVLRDQSALLTLGGGRVLDVFPPTRHKRAPARLAALRLMAAAGPQAALGAALAQQPAGVDLERYALNFNFSGAAALWKDMDLVVVAAAGTRLGFTRGTWAQLAARLLEATAAEHGRSPDMIGVGRDRLRRLALPTLAGAVFERLVEEALAAGTLAQTGGWLHLPGHRAVLAEGDARLWQGLAPLLDDAPFQPPRVRDIARTRGLPEDKVRGLLGRAARVGFVYPVAHDHYFTAGAAERLAGHVDELCRCDGAARAAALRDRIGGGRKVAVQILEFFDRVGYTRRVRDVHVRRQPATARQWVLQ